MILLNGHVVKFGQFPNGERNLNHNNIGFSSPCVVTLRYESDQDLMDLYILKRYMDSVVSTKATLNILYMPYSRMDRANDVYTFNLKYIADFINSLNFSQVILWDAHSDVSLALINNVVNRSAIPSLFTKLSTERGTANLTIMYPDAGAQKRYSKVFSYPSVVGYKERNFTTGEITDFKVSAHNMIGQDVVIVDDLCSKGGTFVGAAKALAELGVSKIFLIVAHCENTIFDGGVFNYIDKVYTTNSILDEGLVRNNGLEDRIYIEQLEVIKRDRY